MQIDITKSNFKPFNILSLNYIYSNEEKRNLERKPSTPLHHLLMKTIKDYPEGGNTNTETIIKMNEFDSLNAYNESKRDSSANLIFKNHIDNVINKNLLPQSLSYVLKQLYSTDIIFKEKFIINTRIYKPSTGLDYLYYYKLNEYRSQLVNINYKTQEELKTYNNVYNFLRKSILKISDLSLLLNDIPKLIDMSNEFRSDIDIGLTLENIKKYNNIESFVKDSIVQILKEPSMLKNLKTIMDNRIKNILVEYFIENILVSNYKGKVKDLEYDIETVKKDLNKKGLLENYKERIYKLYESDKIRPGLRQDEINRLRENYNSYTIKYIALQQELGMSYSEEDVQDYFGKIKQHVLELCFNHMFNVLYKNRFKKGIKSENIKDFFDRIKYDIRSLEDERLSLYDKLWYVFKEELKNTYKDFFSLNIFEYVKQLVNVDVKNKGKSVYDTKFSEEFHLRLMQTSKYTLVDNTDFYMLLDDNNVNVYTRVITHLREIKTSRKMKYKKLLDFNYLYNKNDRFKKWIDNQSVNMIHIFNSTIDLFSSSGKETYEFISRRLYDNNIGLLEDMSYNIHSIYVPKDLYNLSPHINTKNDEKKFYTLLWKLLCIRFALLMISIESRNNVLSIDDRTNNLIDVFEKLHVSSMNKTRDRGVDYYIPFIQQNISSLVPSSVRQVERYITEVIYGKDRKANNVNVDLLLNVRR